MRKIEFFSSIDGLQDAFPIKLASEQNFKWVDQARKNYKSHVQQEEGRQAHIYRCPGIFDVMESGYIIPMPWDLTIETNGMEDFKWHVPTGDIVDLFHHTVASGHKPGTTSNLLPPKAGSFDTVIKINTPWNIIAPPDVKFLMIPIPYPDSYEFEGLIGILDPGLSTEVNVQLRWNIPEGRYTIKAGTPLAQLIPLTSEKFMLETRYMTDKDERWLKKRQYFNNATFLMNRPLLKKMYAKFFGI